MPVLNGWSLLRVSTRGSLAETGGEQGPIRFLCSERKDTYTQDEVRLTSTRGCDLYRVPRARNRSGIKSHQCGGRPPKRACYTRAFSDGRLTATSVQAEISQASPWVMAGAVRLIREAELCPCKNPPRCKQRRPASWLDLGKTVASLQERRRSDRGRADTVEPSSHGH